MKKSFLLLFVFLIFCAPVFAAEAKNKEPWYSKFSIFQSHKEISNNIWAINKLKAEQEKLSKSDKDTLSKYVFGAVKGEDTFLLINSHYMGTLHKYIPAKEITKPLVYRLEYYAKAVQAIVSKARLPQNIILYCGIDERDMLANFSDKEIQRALEKPVNEDNAELLTKKLENKIYNQKGFLKAYYDSSYVHKAKYRFKMKTQEGLQAVLLEGIGRAGAKEILINRNQQWKIINVEADFDKITKEHYYLILVKQN